MKSSFTPQQYKYSYHLNLMLNKTGILLKTKQNEGQTGSVTQRSFYFCIHEPKWQWRGSFDNQIKKPTSSLHAMAHNWLAFQSPSPTQKLGNVMQRTQLTKITRLYPICPKFAYFDLLDNENNTICLTEDYVEIRNPGIDPDHFHGFMRQILIWL